MPIFRFIQQHLEVKTKLSLHAKTSKQSEEQRSCDWLRNCWYNSENGLCIVQLFNAGLISKACSPIKDEWVNLNLRHHMAGFKESVLNRVTVFFFELVCYDKHKQDLTGWFPVTLWITRLKRVTRNRRRVTRWELILLSPTHPCDSSSLSSCISKKPDHLSPPDVSRSNLVYFGLRGLGAKSNKRCPVEKYIEERRAVVQTGPFSHF